MIVRIVLGVTGLSLHASIQSPSCPNVSCRKSVTNFSDTKIVCIRFLDLFFFPLFFVYSAITLYIGSNFKY